MGPALKRQRASAPEPSRHEGRRLRGRRGAWTTGPPPSSLRAGLRPCASCEREPRAEEWPRRVTSLPPAARSQRRWDAAGNMAAPTAYGPPDYSMAAPVPWASVRGGGGPRRKLRAGRAQRALPAAHPEPGAASPGPGTAPVPPVTSSRRLYGRFRQQRPEVGSGAFWLRG